MAEVLDDFEEFREWAAIKDGEIVATAESKEEAINKAERKGEKNFVVRAIIDDKTDYIL